MQVPRCGSEQRRDRAEDPRRERQADAIAAFVDAALAGPETDLLIIGDYNMIPVDGQTNFDHMSPNTELEFASSEDLGGLLAYLDWRESGESRERGCS